MGEITKTKDINDITQGILQLENESGEISINTIADLVDGYNFSIDDLEKLYQELEKNNIKVVNENDDVFYTDDTENAEDEYFACHSADRSAHDDFKDIATEYLDEIRELPLLTDSQEAELLKSAAAGDDSAVKRLLESNLRLSVEIAKSFGDTRLPFMDLVQEGNLGLLEAINTYDINRSQSFKSYAQEIIRQYMSLALKDFDEQTDKPVNTAKDLNRLMEVTDRFYKENGRNATLKELSAEMGMSEEDVTELFTIAQEIMGHGEHEHDCEECGRNHGHG